jgi:hypothetical protein
MGKKQRKNIARVTPAAGDRAALQTLAVAFSPLRPPPSRLRPRGLREAHEASKDGGDTTVSPGSSGRDRCGRLVPEWCSPALANSAEAVA